jgi:tetratricopeptide (TPR) repeat protein
MRLDALPLGIVLTLLAALPSYFNLSTHLIFEEEKSLLLRAGALVAAPAVLVAWRPDARRLISHPIAIALAALLTLLVITTVFAILPREALMGAYLRRHGLLTWLAVGVLFVTMVTALRWPGTRDLIVAAMVSGAVWPSIYILLQRADLDAFRWIAPSDGFKAGGTFGNHVLTGGYLALVIPVTALLAWRGHRGWLAVLVLELAALAATGSRGAVLAVAAGSATGALAAAWRLAPRRIVLASLAVVLVAAVAAIGTPSLRPRALAEPFDPQSGSARVRILIWQNALDIARTAGPRVLYGHGLDSFRALMPAHYSPEIGYWEQIDAMPDRAHNETLEMLVAAGVAGMLLQLGWFAIVIAGALRLDDLAWRCALAAAAVGHVVELQFGVASATTRLGFAAIAVLVIGAQQRPAAGERTPAGVARWLVAALAVAAASPALSVLPSVLANPMASGGEAQFIAYLQRMSAATPVLYGVLLVIAAGLGSAIGRHWRSAGAWWRWPALATSVWVAAVAGIAPSRADAFAAAGHAYEREQRWPEAAIAHAAAARAQPSETEFHSNHGRAAIEWALRSEPAARGRLLEQGRAAFEQAAGLNAFDIDAQRRLAAYPRIRASLVDGEEREAWLGRADAAYAAVSRRAPTSPAVWTEWAWVDFERGRIDDARTKVTRALRLNARHPAALALNGRLQVAAPP